MSTQQNWRVTATVGGIPLDAFDTKTGGDVTGEPTRHRSGGTRTEKLYGVRQSYTDVTITRAYERERDHELVRQLRPLVGIAQGTVLEQPLDVNELPWGKPVTSSGMLRDLQDGESNVNSTEVRMLTLVFAITSVR